MSQLSDRVCHLIVFDDTKEMEDWMKNKAALRELKRTYAPSEHHCFCNKEFLLVTVMRKAT